MVLALIIPQVTFAAWWNPFSWFNHWSFRKTETKTEILEKRVAELEQKLASSTTPTPQATSTTKRGELVKPKTTTKPAYVPISTQPAPTPTTPTPTNTSVTDEDKYCNGIRYPGGCSQHKGTYDYLFTVRPQVKLCAPLKLDIANL